MYCTHCGRKIEDDSLFCVYCGKSQKVIVEGSDQKSQNINKLVLVVIVVIALVMCFGGGILVYTSFNKKNEPVESVVSSEEETTALNTEIEEETTTLNAEILETETVDVQVLELKTPEELYREFIVGKLNDEYGGVGVKEYERKVFNNKTSTGVIMGSWYESALKAEEKGVISTRIIDMDGDGIQEMIAVIIRDDDECVELPDGNVVPKDARAEVHIYGIRDEKVIELSQKSVQYTYNIMSKAHTGTWCCFVTEQDGQKYLMILSFFSNGTYTSSEDVRACVYKISGDVVECVYSGKLTYDGWENVFPGDSYGEDENCLYQYTSEYIQMYERSLIERLIPYGNVQLIIQKSLDDYFNWHRCGNPEKLDIAQYLKDGDVLYGVGVAQISIQGSAFSSNSDYGVKTVEYRNLAEE